MSARQEIFISWFFFVENINLDQILPCLLSLTFILEGHTVRKQGPNHLLIWWQISVKSQDILTEFLHLAGALMEHFLEGFGPLGHWYINPNEKSNKYKSYPLS